MGKPLLFCFLLLPFASLTAQTPRLDSLVRALPSLSGAEKADALNRLAGGLLRHDLARAQNFAAEALDLAKKSSHPRGEADALDHLGLVFQEKHDYERAMQSFLEALKIRDLQKDERGRAASCNRIGRVFLLLEDYVQAEKNLRRGLETWQKLGNAAGAAEASESLGDVFLAQKIYGKSLEHYRSAMERKLSGRDAAGAAETAAHMGSISADLGDYDSALAYFRTSLDLHRELGDAPAAAADHNRMALALLAQGEPEEALEAAQAASGIWKSARDTFGLAESAKNFGLVFLKMNDPAKAAAHFDRSAALLRNRQAVPGAAQVFQEVADGYARLGDFAKAFAAHQAYAAARHEIFNQEKTKALLELTTKYESQFAAREREQKIKLLEIENAANRKMNFFLAALALLAGALAASLFASYRRKQQDNRLLLAKNAKIQRQSHEIDAKNTELQHKNTTLDLLNKKLVDEIAERENIEKSSFARDRYLATMSHEMRTPLNAITGMTHLLLDGDPRPDQAELLRTLQFSANDLVVFINDVLDFSKIEAGKLDLEDREFAPAALLQEVRQRGEQAAEEKGLLFHFHYDTGIPARLLGDSPRLRQILSNLLGNSFKQTQSGSVSLEVALCGLDAKTAGLQVTVEGTDGGFERQALEQMFERGARRGDFEGYENQDLSLAITKRLIELQKGMLEIQSRRGEGTRYTVILPFKLAAEPKAAGKELVKKTAGKALPVPSARDFAHLPGSRILVVEDNKINQLVVAKMLRRLGVEVATADHGLEALEAVEREQFDLILMDIQMPRMDGYRATAEIRRHPDPHKARVPIIALTASAFLTEKEKARLFGMNDHVGKPFSPEELMEKISACLEGRLMKVDKG